MGSINTSGNVIRTLRLQQGLTQLQLAELASVSERTIRSAEKNQRISCSHLAYIAEALGVAAVHIARSPVCSGTERCESTSLHRMWDVMFGRLPALTLESLLSAGIQIHSCGQVPDFPRPELFFRKYSGIKESSLFFEQFSDYLESLGRIEVKVAELCRFRSAVALQGMISGSPCEEFAKGLQIVSFAVLEEEKIVTFVNHIDSTGEEDFGFAKNPACADLEISRPDLQAL